MGAVLTIKHKDNEISYEFDTKKEAQTFKKDLKHIPEKKMKIKITKDKPQSIKEPKPKWNY